MQTPSATRRPQRTAHRSRSELVASPVGGGLRPDGDVFGVPLDMTMAGRHRACRTTSRRSSRALVGVLTDLKDLGPSSRTPRLIVFAYVMAQRATSELDGPDADRLHEACSSSPLLLSPVTLAPPPPPPCAAAEATAESRPTRWAGLVWTKSSARPRCSAASFTSSPPSSRPRSSRARTRSGRTAPRRVSTATRARIVFGRLAGREQLRHPRLVRGAARAAPRRSAP